MIYPRVVEYLYYVLYYTESIRYAYLYELYINRLQWTLVVFHKFRGPLGHFFIFQNFYMARSRSSRLYVISVGQTRNRQLTCTGDAKTINYRVHGGMYKRSIMIYGLLKVYDYFLNIIIIRVDNRREPNLYCNMFLL